MAIPFRPLGLFFDNVLNNMIADHLKLQSHRGKVEISFEIINEKNLFIVKHDSA